MMIFIAPMDIIYIPTIFLVNNFGMTYKEQYIDHALRHIYHHIQLSYQHESIQVVVSIPMVGWSIHFIAQMDLIEIPTIALVTNLFRPKTKA